jgi:Protein of unknown function (DUF732)
MRLLGVLASLAVIIGLAAPAHADPDSSDPGLDTSFLNALDRAGITYSNGANAVAAAKTACGLMDQGQPEIDVIKHVTEQNPGFTVSGAAKFTAIAASAYCPEHLSLAGDSGGDKGGT